MKRDNVAFRLLQEEQTRQKNSLNLVASENYVSGQVLLALGSVFTNKYSEGYPRNRYYGGNEVVDKVENLARERVLKLFKLNEIAQSVGAFVMVDMSHFAGLVAGRVYPSPFPYADVVTTTTHKTLRGPRRAMIFAKKELARKIDRAVFPGFQGGPHNHQTLAIAVALHEALQPSFVSYAKRVKNNAVVLALELKKRGWEIITGGTDSHVLLVNVSANGVAGYQAETMLEEANIVVNKNTIPYDERPPSDPSGIRLGTPAVTTRGMRVREMKLIADLIDRALKGESAKSVRRNVLELVKKFPIP